MPPAASVHISRRVAVPDPVRVQRYQRMPELGPRVLFFSGGSALRPVSRVLKRYTHNSIHLITPFDSGGSSAQLRDAFDMLSVGDLRNRVIALADETVSANPEIYALFSHRLASSEPKAALMTTLDRLVRGVDPMMRAVPEPLRRIVRTHLRHFWERMPGDFDLRGASIGNLILAGGYLANEHDIDSVVYLFSNLVHARGQVRPIVSDALHLCARYTDGTVITGQHLLTGKEVASHDGTIDDIWLVRGTKSQTLAATSIDNTTRSLIAQADLICFPMGSFFSSVAANLLPVGVGRSIVETSVPKVYIPNLGVDPEQRGLSVQACIDKLVSLVRRDVGDHVRLSDVIQHVLIDSTNPHYTAPPDVVALRERGLSVIDISLTSASRPLELDPSAVTEALLSLA